MSKTKCIITSLAFILILTMTYQLAYAQYQSTAPWPMYRHNQQHQAYLNSPAPTSDAIIWQSLNLYPQATPIVVEGKVIFGGTGSRIYALDETTGVEIWRSIALAGNPSVSAAYENGRIYAGTYNGYLYCLNVSTGEKIWENQLTSSGNIVGPPTVAQNKVFVGTTDNYLFACNTSNGQYGDWYYIAPNSIRSSPAVSDGIVYFGCDDGKLYALDTSNPAGFLLKWRFTVGTQNCRSTPCVAGGKVFVGSAQNEHSIYALNATTTDFNGELIWKYTLDAVAQAYDSHIAFHDNVVYFGGYSGKVYALNANASPGNYTENQPGCKIWSQTIGSAYVYQYSVALAEGSVIASNGSSRVVNLDMTDGHEIWNVELDQNPRDPVVADGRVFTTSYNKVYCVGEYFPPVTYYYTVTPPGAGGSSFNIRLDIGNATPTQTIDTQILVTLKKINYNATGIDSTVGMSNITIPHDMLGGPYTVRVNQGIVPSPTITTNGTHSSIYFTYFQSVNMIEIQGTTAVPESPLALLISLMVLLAMFMAMLAKKRPMKA